MHDVSKPSSRSWKDMSERQQRVIVVLGTIQAAMALAAWLDLARRSSEQVTRSKRIWAAVICINFFGPITYFVLGRRSDPPQQALRQ